jgi:hypothetical protein
LRGKAFLPALLLVGCSFGLDFNTITDLPCPCLDNFVCLQKANRCVPMNSVDDFKSCSLDAVNPDDLCHANSICVNNQGRGPKCLQKCTPTLYNTPNVGTELQAECPTGTTCWQTDRGAGDGVCDVGECTDLPNNCPAPQVCTTFNGAGVCFTPCQIFINNSCVGPTEACHTLGATANTACLATGTVDTGQICSDTAPCMKNGTDGRPLVCSRPMGSQDMLRCLSVCSCLNDGSMCMNNLCPTGSTCNFVLPKCGPRQHVRPRSLRPDDVNDGRSEERSAGRDRYGSLRLRSVRRRAS